MKRHSSLTDHLEIGRVALTREIGPDADTIDPKHVEEFGRQLEPHIDRLGRDIDYHAFLDKGSTGALFWEIRRYSWPTPPYKRNARRYGR